MYSSGLHKVKKKPSSLRRRILLKALGRIATETATVR